MECFLWTTASVPRNQITSKYEPLQPFLFLSFLEFSNVKVVLDVGANIGVYSHVATLANSVESIYAFEPDENAYKELENNILLNGVQSKVKPIRAAVSNAEGILRFGSHAPMAGVNSVIETSIHDQALFKDVKDVSAMRLDQLEGIRGKVLGIKIDVEGHELEVIGGAVDLLKESPAVIQLEHYLGGQIDRALSALGYFRFFVAGHDHYFTNIRNFANPLFVKRAVEYAVSWLVESRAGRWPGKRTIKDSFSLSCKVNEGVIDVEASLDGGYFSDNVEYAFYLMVNGVKAEVQSYRPEPHVQFPMPADADSVEVKGFVREISRPDKKVITGVFIKQPATGYRARSAVNESLDLPSSYAAMVSQIGGADLGYPEVNFSVLIEEVSERKPENVIHFGVDAGALEIVAVLQKNMRGRLNIVCPPTQLDLLNKACWRSGLTELIDRINVYFINRPEELKRNLEALGDKLQKKVTCVVLRAQFLADLGVNLDVLSALFERMPSGSRIYTDALADESYHTQLKQLACQYNLEIEWLYQRSTIIPSEWICVKRSGVPVYPQHMEGSHKVNGLALRGNSSFNPPILFRILPPPQENTA